MVCKHCRSKFTWIPRGKYFCSDTCRSTYAGNEAAKEQQIKTGFDPAQDDADVVAWAYRVAEGKKFDQDKLRTELLPIEAIEDIAQVFTFGAKKYGDRNWEKGMKWTRLIGASLRHLFAFIKGEDLDEETGLSHLAHLGCCVLMLLTYRQTHKELDDRVKIKNKKEE